MNALGRVEVCSSKVTRLIAYVNYKLDPLLPKHLAPLRLPITMPKRQRSTVPPPEPKRQHLNNGKASKPKGKLNFDVSLHDELVLVIFSHLSWIDLCAIQPINRHWARLATDNQVRTA